VIGGQQLEAPVIRPGGGDVEIAITAAQAAAHALLEIRSELTDRPQGDRELGQRGDLKSHQVLCGVIEAACPGDAILSEESVDNPARANGERVWIIDPLDGTREFGEAGRTDWAVHVALVRSGALAVGVVALPALGLTLSSAKPPRLAHRSGPIRVAVSRTRPPDMAVEVTRRLGGVMIPMGSAGAKAMAVLLGWADVYLHAGGQYEWDSAAPVAVARAAGLSTSRIDGSPLAYNRFPAWLPDIVICRPELASSVLDAVRASS
jgi:3'(2'), 5'-bisphosphate nucleotidase